MLLLLLPTWLLGCRPDPEPPSRPDTEDTSAASDTETALTADTGHPPLQAEWVPDPHSPTFATVAFPGREGQATLSWTDAAGEHTRTVDAAVGELRVLGVPAGSEVTWSLAVDGPWPDATKPQSVSVPDAPEPLAAWTTTTHAPAEMADHWLLAHQFTFGGRSFAVVVDPEGRVRWWREAEPGHRILRVRLAEDGGSLVWGSNIANRSSDDGFILRAPLDGSPETLTVAPRFHHDFVEDDGGYAFLAHVDKDVALDGRGSEDPMSSDAIRLVDEGAEGTYEDVFSFFDDWPADPSQPCNHATLGHFVPNRIEWTHSNSLMRAHDGDGWWILPRYLDQIAKVDASGTLRHIIGGDEATLSYAGKEKPFAHAHASQLTAEGHLLIFSNGDHEHRLEGSKVVELHVDDDAGTVSEVWTTPEPEGRFSHYLGDAKRLPGGNTLIANPDHGVYEVTPDGTIVWEGHQDPEVAFDQNVGRIEAVPPWFGQ